MKLEEVKQLFIKWYGLDLSKGMAGLGPNSWGWIRILIPFQKSFYKGSCLHDYLYSEGKTNEDKIYADNIFYETNLENCNNKLKKYFNGLYYFLVKSYGYLFFNRGKNERYIF